jgi:hypothetical protein
LLVRFVVQNNCGKKIEFLSWHSTGQELRRLILIE